MIKASFEQQDALDRIYACNPSPSFGSKGLSTLRIAAIEYEQPGKDNRIVLMKDLAELLPEPFGVNRVKIRAEYVAAGCMNFIWVFDASLIQDEKKRMFALNEYRDYSLADYTMLDTTTKRKG